MIKRVYNYSEGNAETGAVTLKELIKLVNANKSGKQWVKLIVRHPLRKGDQINACALFEGLVESDGILKPAERFGSCYVRDIISEGIGDKMSELQITVDYHEPIPFELDESNIEIYHDAFMKYE